MDKNRERHFNCCGTPKVGFLYFPSFSEFFDSTLSKMRALPQFSCFCCFETTPCFGKIVCEKQISATDLWHIRAGCALVHSTIFLAIWLISDLDTNGMRFCYSFSKSSLIIVLNSVSDGFCTVSILVACAIATLSKKFLTPLFCFNSQVSPDSACKNQSGLLIGPVRSITGF